MKKIKKYLNNIRKPIKIDKKNKIINTILIFIFGVLLGIFSKWLDNLSIDNTIWWQNIIDILDLRNIFSMFGIWLFIGICISVYSKTPLRASLNVFLFFICMIVSYHLYTILFSGFNPLNYMLIWYLITLISPILAYICWYSKSENKLSLIISSVILSIMFISSFNIGIWYFDIKSIIDVLIFISSILVLHVNIKNTVYSLLIGFFLLFIISIIF